MRTPFISILILLLPLAEIAGFVVVGQMVGVWGTLGLVLLSCLAGLILLRLQGLQMLRRLTAEGRDGRVPGDAIVQGAMIVVAAVLLLIPGFITDIIGIAIFIPAVRRLLWSFIGRRFVVINSTSYTEQRTHTRRRDSARDERVVDLDEEDFHREPKPGSPWSDRRPGED